MFILLCVPMEYVFLYTIWAIFDFAISGTLFIIDLNSTFSSRHNFGHENIKFC